MNTPFHHPYRIDTPTLARATSVAGNSSLINMPQLPENVRFVAVNPAVFTHAYLLLGEQPQRFVNDLTLYLSTVRAFFERDDAVGGINMPTDANSDSRRRLSEDLGVALAAYFMVKVFGLSWKSISQIPQNSKLSKKRPDFQGYTNANQRYLFEAKGTTKLPTIEKIMTKAIKQVKDYPEVAEAKIAIVSYLSADERFFPSTSFVVDPPALPEEVKPDEETSRLLHFEKVLQFAGLPQTAKRYVSTLSHQLRENHRIEKGGKVTVARARYNKRLEEELRKEFTDESQANSIEKHIYGEVMFLGRRVAIGETKVNVFFGAQIHALNAGIEFKSSTQSIKTELIVTETEITSVFPDGTILYISGLNGERK